MAEEPLLAPVKMGTLRGVGGDGDAGETASDHSLCLDPFGPIPGTGGFEGLSCPLGFNFQQCSFGSISVRFLKE